MFENPAVPALLKIALTFVVMLFLINRQSHIWFAILLGAFILGMLFGLPIEQIALVGLKSFVQPSAICLFGVVFFIMMLSVVQQKSGQGRRLVAHLTPYMKSPRLRLAFFPALIGLLGVPGGAIFSCPMVRDVAHGYDIPNRKLVSLNYWFRHIWETSWPLYPGYLMACALADIPVSLLWRYTCPAIFFNCLVGWLFFLRTPIDRLPEITIQETEKLPLHIVLLDTLPLVVGIGLAPVVSFLFKKFGINAPGGSVFVVTFFLAAMTSIYQDKIPLSALPSMMLKPHVGKMLGLILMIFLFKDIVIEANVVEALAALSGKGALLILAVVLPAIMGALTGLMLGFVGSVFPLLLALITQAGLYDERLCWVILCLMAGNFGQMITPMHSCYLLTLEFFKEHLSATWPSIFFASIVHFTLCCAYIAAMYFLVKPILP